MRLKTETPGLQAGDRRGQGGSVVLHAVEGKGVLLSEGSFIIRQVLGCRCMKCCVGKMARNPLTGRVSRPDSGTGRKLKLLVTHEHLSQRPFSPWVFVPAFSFVKVWPCIWAWPSSWWILLMGYSKGPTEEHG